MTDIAAGRVRLAQGDRCFRLITGGKTEGGIVEPLPIASKAPTYTPAEIAAATAPAKHKPLISTEALFGLGYALGLATGALLMAFLIRAGVLL